MMTLNMTLQNLSFLDLGNAMLSQLAIISLILKPNPGDVAALLHIESYFHRPTVTKKIPFSGTCHHGGSRAEYIEKCAELDQPSVRPQPN